MAVPRGKLREGHLGLVGKSLKWLPKAPVGRKKSGPGGGVFKCLVGEVADCMMTLVGFPEEGSASSKTFLPNPPLQLH